MKKFITTLLLTSAVFAAGPEVDLNKMSEQAALIRKYQSELDLKNKQLEMAKKSLQKVHNQYAAMYENYRKLASEKQFLKYQNIQLVQEIQNSGEYSEKLAEKVKGYTGRMPASVKEK